MLSRCLASLAVSVNRARAANLVDSMEVFVLDNAPPGETSRLDAAALAWPASAGPIHVRAGQGNVGYGRAHNLVIDALRSDVHLVMNPDVEIADDAITAMLETLRDEPAVGLVAPSAVDARGAPQYLCKRYPSVWVLFLRGFGPAFLRRLAAAPLARYEMRDVIGERVVRDVPIASGCFMAVRTGLFRAIGGFDSRYFMYFEDFDLSLRFATRAKIAYVPRARIVHHGGNASAKGPRHVLWFVRSALRFFSRHGWKIA